MIDLTKQALTDMAGDLVKWGSIRPTRMIVPPFLGAMLRVIHLSPQTPTKRRLRRWRGKILEELHHARA